MSNKKTRKLPHQTGMSQLKVLSFGLAVTVILAGCNFGSDDDNKNVAPNAVSLDLTTQTEIAITDMLSATDDDGDGLLFSLGEAPTQGSVTVSDNGDFTYQPNPEVTGSDSFTFSVNDGINESASGTVNITIEALTVSFNTQSRAAFAQQSQDEPLVTNGRSFTQDVEDPDAYNDLLPN
ncbi:Ig-like domain-containing protein [Paraglaciecola sp. L1A13]|uniref:Ig-like domain-containing protein n=1 Tax=Paraglaciecola sp. L1A13 TaxID=2686359 RepID=UPI00131B0C87|nr:Ig-like domain-containing protein [Paraglaciecola sp. L1A13]